MLELIEKKNEKTKYQRELKKQIRESFPSEKDGGVATPGGNMDARLYLSDDEQFWYAHIKIEEPGIEERHWNGFGYFDATKKFQAVIVEINIPTESNSKSVAGFFAKNTSTGEVLLMHSGKIGGGIKGIGQKNFLAWRGEKTLDVVSASEGTRAGFVVCGLSSPTIRKDIAAFVNTVNAFKTAVKNGEHKNAHFKRQEKAFVQYTKEYAGQINKKGNKEVSYWTNHGHVVHALKQHLLNTYKDSEINNTPLIDLYVSKQGKTFEVFEVKTTTDRQSLYTAIGQIITHSLKGNGVRKHIVLPSEGKIPKDIAVALKHYNINVMTYRLDGTAQVIWN